jgi:hypothetical protein
MDLPLSSGMPVKKTAKQHRFYQGKPGNYKVSSFERLFLLLHPTSFYSSGNYCKQYHSQSDREAIEAISKASGLTPVVFHWRLWPDSVGKPTTAFTYTRLFHEKLDFPFE